jgi:hypothetical protein
MRQRENVVIIRFGEVLHCCIVYSSDESAHLLCTVYSGCVQCTVDVYCDWVLYPQAIFTKSSQTLFTKCSQTYSYLLGRVGGWGQGEACIPPAAPTPLTLLYTLLYNCTVHELCSRTVGEYRL